ncbi:Phenylalanyl-tRNA synthetase beta chain, partial [Dunaliella salina]
MLAIGVTKLLSHHPLRSAFFLALNSLGSGVPSCAKQPTFSQLQGHSCFRVPSSTGHSLHFSVGAACLHTSPAAAMPTVSVVRDQLFDKLGRSFTGDEFQDLCFEYGIELDDVTTEKEILRKEHNKPEEAEQHQQDAEAEEVIYKIDIPANRYDMLCVEGIARALNVFKHGAPPASYTLAPTPKPAMQRLTVKPETALVRPFVVCAVLRGVSFDAARYKSFIDLQDKLHQNLCRQRSLVAIGTHDLSTIKGPFTYEALPPDQISFVPLKQTREFKANDLMQHYLENDLKIRKFVPIIKDSVVYPVIYDANRTVLSLPPIINGAHSALTVPISAINGTLGLGLSADATAQLLRRMELQVEVSADGSALHIKIPSVYTQGKELPLNQLTELLRGECAMAGYTEVLTWALCSRLENFDNLRRENDGSAVEIGDPATAEFEVCRTTLVPAALKTLGANKDAALPIKLFEISDVIGISEQHETGARNQRHLVAVYCNKEAGFEVIHGLLNRVMEVLGVPLTGTDPALESKAGVSYSWTPSQDPVFFSGRQATVHAGNQEVGAFGIIHPEVLEKFDIPFPVSALELNIEPFCFDQNYKSLLHKI